MSSFGGILCSSLRRGRRRALDTLQISLPAPLAEKSSEVFFQKQYVYS
jgi:hypothetical protein